MRLHGRNFVEERLLNLQVLLVVAASGVDIEVPCQTTTMKLWYGKP